jgi:predicted dehydrogenase
MAALMRIALVGCGYVADFYARTIPNHHKLEIVSVMDRDPARAEQFAAFHNLRRVSSLSDVLSDPRVDLVVNLTNPSSHHEVSKAALLAGKHVYSEKPLAMSVQDAEELVAIARSRGVHISGAPCSVLGETAQTLWKALRTRRVGTVRLVYAEIDDGPVHQMGCESWRSESGAPWPYKDEFEVGCTLEHAGYYVSWFAAFFGPARSVSSFSGCLVPDKGLPVDQVTNDFTVACIEYSGGVIARLTCSIYGPHNHSLRIIGDEGILSIEDCWDYGSAVHLSRRTRIGLKAEKHEHLARLVGLGPKRLPLVRKPRFGFKTRGANRMDFARGIADLADAIQERRPPRIAAEFALHINELVLAIQNPDERGARHVMKTTFEPMSPMPWAT